jgi:hypothetical protein
LARKFLYIVAFGVVLVLAGLLGLQFWAQQLSELAFVPSASFVAPAPLPPGAYADPALWLARPGKGAADPTSWFPRSALAGGPLPGPPVAAAVFYVHPTSYYERTAWNAPLHDTRTNLQTDAFARVQASAFNAAAQLWAPRYRQATFGAILTETPRGQHALDAAYRDVLAAFDQFIADSDPQLPIVLVGHSQGALHVMHLMKDRVLGTALALRIAAVYLPGWPVSVRHDLPEMGLPACTGPGQSGCVLSWMSYAEPADPSATLDAYNRMPGLDGQSRKGSTILCTNPLTGGTGGIAPASANLGTLLPEMSANGGGLVAGMVPARCSPQGFLLIGPAPQLGADVMPGNNYHVYDIPLFWANLRRDVAQRVATWHRAKP